MKDQQKSLLRQAYNQGKKDGLAYSSSERFNSFHLITKHKTFEDWYNKKFKKNENTKDKTS